MDIRLPLGMLFSMFGALLAGFGVATASSQMYRQHSLGINVNLWSGLGMLAFGVDAVVAREAQDGLMTTSITKTRRNRDARRMFLGSWK